MHESERLEQVARDFRGDMRDIGIEPPTRRVKYKRWVSEVPVKTEAEKAVEQVGEVKQGRNVA